MAAFATKLSDEHNQLIKAEAKRIGMSRQKYIEKRIIEDHVVELAKKIASEDK